MIQECESNALCNCNCLYDLEIDIEGIVTQNYLIKFIEPYAADQSQILFEADLSNGNEGSFCVIRKHYPWNVDSMGK